MIRNKVKHIILTILVVRALVKDFEQIKTPKFELKAPKELYKYFTLRNPYTDTKKTRLNINYRKLIDIDFEYKIIPKICSDQPFLMIIIVPSDVQKYEERNFIREAFGKATDAVKIVFTMGNKNDIEMSNHIINESKTHGDIVQGSFFDSYLNLTYKHMMGLKWVTHHCPTARYVVKIDDDIFINDVNLFRLLIRQFSPWGAQGMIACNVINVNQVERNESQKWYVPREEFAPDLYPPHCSGAFIIYSPDVLPHLLKTSETTKFFYIEDVYATGFVAPEIPITLTNIGYLYLDALWIRRRGLEAFKESPHVYGPFNLRLLEIRVMWNYTHNLDVNIEFYLLPV